MLSWVKSIAFRKPTDLIYRCLCFVLGAGKSVTINTVATSKPVRKFRFSDDVKFEDDLNCHGEIAQEFIFFLNLFFFDGSDVSLVQYYTGSGLHGIRSLHTNIGNKLMSLHYIFGRPLNYWTRFKDTVDTNVQADKMHFLLKSIYIYGRTEFG